MKTEDEYVAAIRDLWPSADIEPAALALAREAVEAFPSAPKLWCMLGDLHQLSDNPRYPSADALRCYRRAADLDPSCAEAFESIGFIHFVFTERYDWAVEAFRRAITLGAGVDTFAGLAKTLAEMGRGHDEALRLLDGSPYAASPEIRTLRGEIMAGVWDPVAPVSP